jgi:hypothetical protein
MTNKRSPLVSDPSPSSGTPQGHLVFRSFLALSLVCGARGQAGDEWFVDLAV